MKVYTFSSGGDRCSVSSTSEQKARRELAAMLQNSAELSPSKARAQARKAKLQSVRPKLGVRLACMLLDEERSTGDNDAKVSDTRRINYCAALCRTIGFDVLDTRAFRCELDQLNVNVYVREPDDRERMYNALRLVTRAARFRFGFYAADLGYREIPVGAIMIQFDLL